jgi:hypothetical protein
MQRTLNAIERAQTLIADSLIRGAGGEGATVDQYQRFLSMQYHLTRGVHEYFLECAKHPSMTRRRKLREFLFRFALEEENHYLVAANDLFVMTLDPLSSPIDVILWHAFFRIHTPDKPFWRLGTACVLENLSAGPAADEVTRATSARFLNRENTKFLVLHRHETLPHGKQILEVLCDANLTEQELTELAEGARIGTLFYIRMLEWVLNPSCLCAWGSPGGAKLDTTERSKIAGSENAISA